MRHVENPLRDEVAPLSPVSDLKEQRRHSWNSDPPVAKDGMPPTRANHRQSIFRDEFLWAQSSHSKSF